MDEARVSRIVAQVVEQLRQDGGLSSRGSGPLIQRQRPSSIGGQGIHQSIDRAVASAEESFRALRDCSLEARSAFIEAMRRETRSILPQLARDAVSESGLGRVDDKIAKNQLVADKTPGVEALRPLADSGDHGLTLTEWAPYGVIGSITPCTNPTETILNNGIGMIAAGNSVVFNVHPKAKRLSAFFIDRLNQAISSAGGPPALLNCVDEPTIQSAEELMKHPGVRLLVVTGGGGVVKAAMASGKRAIAAGPGNPPVLVDETADITQAARDIVFGASLDNNIICIVEKEIIAVAEIADQLKRSLLQSNAVEVRGAGLRRLEKLLITPDNHVNRDFIGKDAALILAEAGIRAPESTRIAFAEVEESHPFVQHEMLLPVLGFVRVPNVDEGIRCALRVEHGYGHTAVMHSSDIRALHRYASSANTSIFVKNAPSAAGVGLRGEGFTSWTIASPTGEGMTYAPHFARARRCVLKDAFRIV